MCACSGTFRSAGSCGAGGSQGASSWLSEAVSRRKRLSGAALSLYGSASAISWASAMGSRSRSDRNLLLAIGVLGFCFAPRALTHTRSINTRRTNLNYQSWWIMNLKCGVSPDVDGGAPAALVVECHHSHRKLLCLTKTGHLRDC